MSHERTDEAGWYADSPRLTIPEHVLSIAVWGALIALCAAFWVALVFGVRAIIGG